MKLANLQLFSPGSATNDDVVTRKCLLHDMYRLTLYQILELPIELRQPFSINRFGNGILVEPYPINEDCEIFTLLTKAAPLEAFAMRIRANRAFC